MCVPLTSSLTRLTLTAALWARLFAAAPLTLRWANQLAAQSPNERLAAAQSAIGGRRLDSATQLIRAALDSPSAATPMNRLEASILLGAIQFFRGDTSGAAEHFRSALASEPRLEAPGLAQFDPQLLALFNAQRPPRADVVIDCSTRCPPDVAKPHVLRVPALDWIPMDRYTFSHAFRGTFDLRFVVDTSGEVAAGSIVVVSSDVNPKEFVQTYVNALGRASFAPARSKGRAVPVVLEWVVECEIDNYRHRCFAR